MHGLPCSETNRVSEVFKGFKVHDFEYYGQRNYVFCAIKNVSFNFDFKKLLENALRFVTDAVLNICHAQPISLAWTDPNAGGVTRIANLRVSNKVFQK